MYHSLVSVTCLWEPLFSCSRPHHPLTAGSWSSLGIWEGVSTFQVSAVYCWVIPVTWSSDSDTLLVSQLLRNMPLWCLLGPSVCTSALLWSSTGYLLDHPFRHMIVFLDYLSSCARISKRVFCMIAYVEEGCSPKETWRSAKYLNLVGLFFHFYLELILYIL